MANAPIDFSDLGAVEIPQPSGHDFSDLGAVEIKRPNFADLGAVEIDRASGLPIAYPTPADAAARGEAIGPDTRSTFRKAREAVAEKLEPLTPKNRAFPMVTAEDVAKGNWAALLPGVDQETGQSTRSLNTPGYEAPTVAKVGAGLQRATAGTAEALAPWTIAGGPIGLVSKVPLAGRAISAAFAADMINGLPDQAKAFIGAVQAGDVQTAVESGLGGTLGAFFSFKAMQHAVARSTRPKFDTLGNPIIDPATGEQAYDTIGLAEESPAIRKLFTKRITEEFPPEKLRDVYLRANRGEATPAEEELVRWINQSFESPGKAVRQGVAVTKEEPRIESEFWRNYLGLKEGQTTLDLLGEKGPNAPTTEQQQTGFRGQPQRANGQRQTLEGPIAGDSVSGATGKPSAPVAPKGQSPDPTWQVTVQSSQTMPDGKTVVPGFIQIDDISGGQNRWSSNPDKLREQGYAVPDFSKLPAGRYTFEQASNLLAANPSSTGVTNPNPTDAQKEAGNFSKRQLKWSGLNISIENEAGSIRTGKDATGKPWQVQMPSAYGYINGTEGKDGDHVDVYVGPNLSSGVVYVVDQIDPTTGKFNEHKSMIGFPSGSAARAAYEGAFSDGSGPSRIGAVTAMSAEKFIDWTKGDTSKPLAYKQPKGGESNAGIQKGQKEEGQGDVLKPEGAVTAPQPKEDYWTMAGEASPLPIKWRIPSTQVYAHGVHLVFVRGPRDKSVMVGKFKTREEAVAMRDNLAKTEATGHIPAPPPPPKVKSGRSTRTKPVATKPPVGETKSPEPATNLDLTVSGQGRSVPGHDGLQYVVHKTRKEDVDAHGEFTVMVTKPSSSLVVPIRGYGDTAAAAYARAVDQLKAVPILKQPQPKAEIKSPLDNLSDEDKSRAAELKKKLLGKLGGTYTGFDPEIATIAAELGSLYAKGGVKTFQQFAKTVKEEMPSVWERLKAYLRGVWNQIADLLGLKDVTKEEAEAILAELDKPERPAKVVASEAVAKWIKGRLAKEQSFTGQELFDEADKAFGGTQGEGRYTPKDAYDAMELAVNQFIADDIRFRIDFAGDPDKAVAHATKAVEQLKRLISILPTQTKRTAEQDEFQQFSTPPPLGYVVNWVANIHPSDVVLEPSAGLGGIAVFAKSDGATVVVNELSTRRADLLRQMGFDQVFTENGEQINNILPKSIKPTVVVTNPPFSATAGRMQGVRDTSMATLHLEQDLARLQPGGRLVAIVGEGMAADRPAFKAWWKSIAQRYHLLANISINGDEYKKYGTTFGNQIIVIDKPLPNEVVGLVPPLTGKVDKIEQLIPLLEEIRNERKRTTVGVEQPAAEPKSPAIAGGGETTTRPDATPPVPTGGVGAGSPATSRRPGKVKTSGGRSIRTRPGGSTGVSAGGGPGVAGAGPAGAGPAPATGPAGGGQPGAASVESPRSKPDSALGQDLSVKAAEQAEAKDLEVGAVFENYRPQVAIAGARPHPTPLAESAAMSSVKYPQSAYKPSLPAEVVSQGKLSDAQMESVILAGAAHQRTLPDGTRRGFFIGDGTGVGKGRQNAAILFDNFNQGRKKGVWITADQKLFPDGQRDLEGIGWSKDAMFLHKKVKTAGVIEQKEGVLFTAYSLLRNAARLKQITDWLGPDFDGVIIFDESHKMANAVQTMGARGMKAAAGQALAGIELQTKLPKARIVYVSATGATEVSNLAYAERLGLWGMGTPFPKRENFIAAIGSRGVGAMEIVAKDLKSMGAYLSRNLSFDGVTYEQMEHPLNPNQQEMYNTLAAAWQMVLQNMEQALGITGANLDSRAKSAARSAFWGAHQRFFNQLLTSLQMPTVLEAIKRHVKNGDAVVLQLVNTNESQMERAISKATEEAGEEEQPDLETLDITPREQLIQYVENAFPVDQFEPYTDENGNIRSRPVLDSAGNRVQNAQAVALREELINKLASVRVPVGALDEVIETFGEANVAEVTGRTRRVVTKETAEGKKKVIENRNANSNLADRTAFNADKKQILIFSDAGGTGASYHADRTFKNQRKRQHIVLQPGWRADNAIQGLGRSHRSNQAQTPHFVLASTNVPGHKRFVSTIARRIEQLGALTKGQRQTTSQGIFNARDNLESSYARESLRAFLRALGNNNVPDVKVHDFAAQTGLRMFNEDGQFIGENIQIGQFLNRLLSLNLDMQEKVFKAFSDQLDATIEWHKNNGSLDVGMETLVAQSTKVTSERTIHTDKDTGAKTTLVELEQTHPTTLVKWQPAWMNKPDIEFAKNVRSGMIWQLGPVLKRAKSDGGEEQFRTSLNPRNGHGYLTVNEIAQKFEIIPKEQAKTIWEDAYDKAPKTYTVLVNLITGTVLPVWDRLPPFTRIARVQEDAGRRHLGVVIPSDRLPDVERNFGLTSQINLTPEQAVERVMDNGKALVLSNGWRISRRYVSGENRMEIDGPEYAHQNELIKLGVIMERISYAMRYFIPNGASQASILAKITEHRPIVEVVNRNGAASLTEEPIPERLTAESVQATVDAWKTENPTAPDVEVVNRPEWTQVGTDGRHYGVRGWWDGSKIVLNVAHVADADELRAVLDHEKAHPLLDSPEGQAAIDEAIRQELGGVELTALRDRYRQREGESNDDYRRRVYSEWFAHLKETARSLWKRIIDRVRQFLARFKVVDLTDDEIGRAMMRTLERGEARGEVKPFGDASLTEKPVTDPAEGMTGDKVDIAGVEYDIIGKERITRSQKQQADAQAATYLSKLGLPGIADPSPDGLVFVPKPDGVLHDEIVQPFLAHFTEEVKRQHQPGGDPAYVSSLVNAINRNVPNGNWHGVLSDDAVYRLIEVTVAESSFRGQMLRAITGIQEDVESIGRNAPIYLRRIYAKAFGGEQIEKVVNQVMGEFKGQLTDKEIEHALDGAPEFKGILNRLTAGKPLEFLKRVFSLPFSQRKELRRNVERLAVETLGVSKADAKTLGKAFEQVFNRMFDRVAIHALNVVRQALSANDRKLLKVGSRRGAWAGIERAVKDGRFDAAYVLQRVAAFNGQNVPSEKEIAHVREMAEEIGRLRTVPTARATELAADPVGLARENVIQSAATAERRVKLKRDIETLWSKWTKPISMFGAGSVGRSNMVEAAYEFTAANLLFKAGFLTRQTLDVMTAAVAHIPFRALANVVVQHGGFTRASTQAFWKDADVVIRQAITTQIEALAPAMREFKEAMKGTAEVKNTDRLLSGIALFERVQLRADQLKAQGKVVEAGLTRMFGWMRFSYRFSSALDNLQGVPQEWQEIRTQAYRSFRDNGMTPAEAEGEVQKIVPELRGQFVWALAQAKRILDATGRDYPPSELENGAWHIVKGMAYQRMRELGMPADDFESRNRLMRSTNAWNESLSGVSSIGGVVATSLKAAGQVGKNFPPVALFTGAFGRFGNAIGTGIDRSLTWMGLGMFPSAFGVRSEYIDPQTGIASRGSPWYRTREDRAQRAIEGGVGSNFGLIFALAVLAGYIVVRSRWPRDPKERERWEANGWKPGTAAIQLGDGKEIVISTTVGPLGMIRPWLAGAGALRDAMDRQHQRQAKMDAEAAKKGLPAGKASGMGPADMMGVGLEALWGAAMGGRTAGGLIGSLTDYGTFNASKTAAATLSPFLPGLPGLQEVSRMAGVQLDQNATVLDFMLPLPTSPHAKVNVLGDPAGNPNDLQRIVQVLTGGTTPWLTDAEAGRMRDGYAALYSSGYMPPSIDPGKGQAFADGYRPMTADELEKYTTRRGELFKAELANLGADPSKTAVKAAFDRANAQALTEVGVTPPPVKVAATRPESISRAGSIRGRGVRRLRVGRSGRGGRSFRSRRGLNRRGAVKLRGRSTRRRGWGIKGLA